MIAGGYVSLDVANLARSLRFYIETLGMKLVEQRGATSAVIDSGAGFLIRLLERRGGTIDSTPGITFCVRGALRDAMDVYENRGIEFGPVVEGVGARFTDPDGHSLQMTGR